MSDYKIITVTGTDMVGKETQTKLLQKVLVPSERLSAPDYSHWAGQIIKYILHQQPFYIGDGGYNLPHLQPKHPQILQLLHNINTWDKQERIKEGLKTHHWVFDRYVEDAYAYGTVDGCSLDFLLTLNRDFIPSDKVIVMLGKGFPRPGEVQDMNEKDDSFQEKVREAYRSLARLFPTWELLFVDRYQGRHPNNRIYDSIYYIHSDICFMASKCVGETITSLSRSQVEECVREWQG